MINTLLEHVPIKMEKMEAKDVEIVNNDEQISDDDIVNSEEDENDDDPDEEDVSEDESYALDVDQEVTLLISSDEEAELEAQRIRFPEKRLSRKKSGDSKSSRCTSRNSNSSNASNTTLKDGGKDKEAQKQLPAKEKEAATGVDVKQQQTQQQQRTSPRNKKENNKNLDNLPAAGDLRQVVRRQSNNSTCSVASSLASDSAETESCGNIYVYQEQKKLIFSCEFCDLKYADLENLSCHLHEAHRLFHSDDQEKENSPRNLGNKGNQLPPKSQQSLSVKKEPLQIQTTTAAEATTLPPPPVAALSLNIQSERGLESCGNVFILNHRKIFLICGHCESKYANMELFEKHLRQQHNVFEGTQACNEVNVVPKTEVKEEVFIITEVVEKAQSITSDAMVTIPAEIPLDISFSEPEVAAAEGATEVVEQPNEVDPIETEVISSIQIHDSGVTAAEIPLALSEESNTLQMLISEDTPIDMVMSEPTTILPFVEAVPVAIAATEEVVGESRPSPKKRTRKRRSSPTKTEAPKSPYKRARRNGRKENELETTTTTKSASKRKTTNLKNEDIKSKETDTELELQNETEKQKETETPTQLPTQQLDEVEKETTIISTPIATSATAKRKRKPPIKAKIEKEDPPTITKPEIVPESISGRDEEFLEDPVAEIIEQIQNEMNSSSEQILPDNPPCTIPMQTLPSPFINTSSHAASLSPTGKPLIIDLNSPVDVKPIFITNLGAKRFLCDQCPRAFKKQVRLVEHKRLHTGEKPFPCDECSKQFRLRMQLNEHKLRHSKLKNYVCDVCQLGCCTKQDLNQHMRHHTNDRRFQCNICSKAFVRSSDLKIHMRVHTGEKPFVCDICHKCFRANQNLSVHKKSHMGDASKIYQCEHCDKKFMRNIDRKVHMRSHTGEKPFKCEICDRAYSSKFNVRAHIERDHVASKGKKKPGPKPKALRDELAKQKKLIAELQNQLLQQIKTDEKIIPADDESLDESGEEETSVIVPTSTAQTDTFIISELSSPTSIPLTTIPSPPVLNNPFTKAKQKPQTPVVPLTIKKKIEQKQRSSSSSSSSTCSRTPTPPKAATTTKVVSQKTSLGIQQVSVTVSMQVENVPASTITPEKENAGISNLQLTTSTTSPTENDSNVKKERKITSYFTVVGQKAEV